MRKNFFNVNRYFVKGLILKQNNFLSVHLLHKFISRNANTDFQHKVQPRQVIHIV